MVVSVAAHYTTNLFSFRENNMHVEEAVLELDPIKFANLMWPNVRFYNKQKEIIYSVRDNDETVVVAGNMLGG